MQSQYNSIKDDDDVEHALTYIKKMQNTAKFGILSIDKMTLLTKVMVSRKYLDISIRKVRLI